MHLFHLQRPQAQRPQQPQRPRATERKPTYCQCMNTPYHRHAPADIFAPIAITTIDRLALDKDKDKQVMATRAWDPNRAEVPILAMSRKQLWLPSNDLVHNEHGLTKTD